MLTVNMSHDGSLSTGHANSTKDMLSRLETMILTNANFPLEAIRQQIASSIDIMVHLGRMRDKSRKVIEIVEVVGVINHEIKLNPLFVFKENRDTQSIKVIGDLKITDNSMFHYDKFLTSEISGYMLEEGSQYGL